MKKMLLSLVGLLAQELAFQIVRQLRRRYRL